MALSNSEFSRNFFSEKAVMDRVPPAVRKALSKLGAFVRQRAKSSLRYRDKPSLPGQPPSVHRGRFVRTNKRTGVVRQVSPLKELVYFAEDPSTPQLDVVSGPARGGSQSRVPEILEHGGQTEIRIPVPRPASRKATPAQAAAYRRLIKDGRVVPPKREFQVKRITIAPRPFMFPALEKEAGSGKAAAQFKDLIR